MMSAEQVLALPMDPDHNDSPRATTIREYLVDLLAELWQEQDEFSGKRPFGNSDWPNNLIYPLVTAQVIEGGPDEWGELSADTLRHGRRVIALAIDALRNVYTPPVRPVSTVQDDRPGEGDQHA